jgi:transposase
MIGAVRSCCDRNGRGGQVETRLANLPPCLIGVEACVGAHHLSRKLQLLGHDDRLMPAKYVRPYSKGQKNDFRDAEAITRPHQPSRQSLLHRTAGPYIRVIRDRPGVPLCLQ